LALLFYWPIYPYSQETLSGPTGKTYSVRRRGTWKWQKKNYTSVISLKLRAADSFAKVKSVQKIAGGMVPPKLRPRKGQNNFSTIRSKLLSLSPCAKGRAVCKKK